MHASGIAVLIVVDMRLSGRENIGSTSQLYYHNDPATERGSCSCSSSSLEKNRNRLCGLIDDETQGTGIFLMCGGWVGRLSFSDVWSIDGLRARGRPTDVVPLALLP